MGLRLPVVIDYITKTRHPICVDNTCEFTSKCAQHDSAGQFREESGFTPDLAFLKSGWACTKQETNKSGMLIWVNGKYVQYQGPGYSDAEDYDDSGEVDEFFA